MAEVASRVTPGLTVGDTHRGGRIARVIDAANGKYVWVESAPDTVGSSDIVSATPATIPANLIDLETNQSASGQPDGITWQAIVGTAGNYRLAQVIGGAWEYTDTGQSSPVADVIIRDVTPTPVPLDVTALEAVVAAAGQPTNEIWVSTVGIAGAYQTAKVIGGVWDLAINDPNAAAYSLVVTQKWTNLLNMDFVPGNVLFDVQTDTGPSLSLFNVPVGVTQAVVANNGTVDYAVTGFSASDNPSVVSGSPGTWDVNQNNPATVSTLVGGELVIPPGESRSFLVSRSTIPGPIVIEPISAPDPPVAPVAPPDPTAEANTAFPQLTTTELGGRMFQRDDGALIGVRDPFVGGPSAVSGRFVTAANEALAANLFDGDLTTVWSFASASWETLTLSYAGGASEVLREVQVTRARYDLSTTSALLVRELNTAGAWDQFQMDVSATSPNPLYQARQNRSATALPPATNVRFYNLSGQRELLLELQAWVEDARDVSGAVTAGTVYEVTVPVSNIDSDTDQIDHENPSTVNGLFTATTVDGSGTLTLTPLAPKAGLATIDGTGFVDGDGLVRVADEASLGTPSKAGVFGYAELENSLWISNAAGTAWDPAGGSAPDNTITIAPTPGTDTANTVVIPKVHNGAPLSAVEFKLGDRRPGQTGRRATETILAADLTGTVARTATMGALYFYEFAVTDGANDLTVDTTEIHGASPNTFGAMFEAVAYYQAAGASTFDELTDTDTTGVADRNVFAWDATGSRLVPVQNPTARTPVAAEADIYTYEADHLTEPPLVVGDRFWVTGGGELGFGAFREVLQAPVASPVHLSGWFGDVLLTGNQWSSQPMWSTAPQWSS